MGMHKTVGLVGASGFLGRHAAASLSGGGARVIGFRRRPGGDVAGVSEWRDTAGLDLRGLTAVINLAGEPISRRWTRANRELFSRSRAGLVRGLVEAMERIPRVERPELLVSASAVGIYGDRGNEVLDEGAPAGEGELAELCVDWEDAAAAARQLGVRVVCLRIGVVLGRDGAAWQRMRRVFQTGLGGRLGSGNQWWSWIHVDDLAAALVRCVEEPSISGPVNLVAPVPVTNREFTASLGQVLGRPAVLPVPAIALRLALGGFANALLDSQRVVPRVLESKGFEFRYPELADALGALVGEGGV